MKKLFVTEVSVCIEGLSIIKIMTVASLQPVYLRWAPYSSPISLRIYIALVIWNRHLGLQFCWLLQKVLELLCLPSLLHFLPEAIPRLCPSSLCISWVFLLRRDHHCLSFASLIPPVYSNAFLRCLLHNLQVSAKKTKLLLVVCCSIKRCLLEVVTTSSWWWTLMQHLLLI